MPRSKVSTQMFQGIQKKRRDTQILFTIFFWTHNSRCNLYMKSQIVFTWHEHWKWRNCPTYNPIRFFFIMTLDWYLMLICPSSWIKKRENDEECVEIMRIFSSPPPWFEHWIFPQFPHVNTASPACKAICVPKPRFHSMRSLEMSCLHLAIFETSWPKQNEKKMKKN